MWSHKSTKHLHDTKVRSQILVFNGPKKAVTFRNGFHQILDREDAAKSLATKHTTKTGLGPINHGQF